MDKRKVQFVINERLIMMMERLSRKKGIPKSAVVAIAVEKYFNEEERNVGEQK